MRWSFRNLGIMLRVKTLGSHFIMTGTEILTYEERSVPMAGPWLWGPQSVPGTLVAFRPHVRTPDGDDERL